MTKHSLKTKLRRLGSLSKVDLPLSKKDDQGKVIEDPRGDQLVPRCVIIQRGEKGYGLTVSGDNPVFVQSVKEDGAAAHAGVQEGDRIIKVNGTLVTQSNHVEVVKLIKSGSYVALTLLGRPLSTSPRCSSSNQIGKNQVSNMNSGLQKPASPSERITGPQPVDSEKLQQLSNSKIHTIRMMLEQELAYLEKLRSEFAKNPIDKTRSELASTQKRCRTLEEQLFNLTGVHHDCGLPQSPRSPPPSRSSTGEDLSNDKDVPPPLPPPRRFHLPHQMSLPNVTVASAGIDSRQIPGIDVDSSPVVSPPSPVSSHRHHSVAHQQMSFSHSMDNIQRVNLPTVMTTSATVPVGIGVRTYRQQQAQKKSHGGPTHSRQRSSPDALLHQTESLRQQQMENIRNMAVDVSRSNSEITSSRKLVASDSFGEGDQPKRVRTKDTPSRTSSFGTYDMIESPRITPPGTPPPPYGCSDVMEMNDTQADENLFAFSGPSPNIRSPDSDDPSCSRLQSNQTPETPPDSHASYVGKTGPQKPIISMEEDDFPSDNEMGHADDHGPFNSLTKLWRHPSHLAVFIHFLISNNDPSSLFFYLVTDLYKEGTAKEMKKWAYEIHSTFLVPGAPLKVNNVEETALHEIDAVLQRDLDKEDILRKVFWKARKKALEDLNEQLAEFRNKRTLGLGGFFGPPDSQLEKSIHDKNQELKIIESLLVPSLETLSEDIENANNRTCALATSLATLLYKLFGVKSPQAINLIERCPTFVAKEKSRIKVFNRNKKAQMVQGHHFMAQHYFNITYCNHCQLIIWGVGNQGYQCQNCEMNIHKACVKVVEETCIGALRNKKDKKRDRMSGIMDNIMGKRKPSSASSIMRKTPEEIEVHILDGQVESGDRQYPASRVEKLKNRYETLCEGEERNGGVREATPPTRSPTESSTTNGDSGRRGTNIGRSESLRARREHQRQSFRKRSDPSIPHSKSDAEDTTSNPSLHPSASSSSCSSSTRSLDSPSNSLETVLRHGPANEVPPASAVTTTHPLPRRDDSNDSDLEAEADPPNWAESVDWDIRKHLKPKETKRQEVINELFHTERTHVRNLKVLERVFYRPMIEQSVFAEHIKLLFPNLEEMLEIHCHFNSMMKVRTKETKIVENVGDLMLEMFDGQSGEKLRKEAATFCSTQAIALEALKSKQKKDQKLAQFLADAQTNALCRRLQLKDIIPMGMHRLTKYPLLMENLAKYTAPNTEEYSNIMKAMECSKEILNHVNQAVKEAENHHRLTELQKKLDKSSFEKADHPIAQEFRNLDLAQYKMIHEGPLSWRINRQKSVELHVLLLENVLVLLQKQDDKYVLKFPKEETKVTHSPIIQLCNLLTRNVATDKKAFFLVSTASTVGPQIYELVAISSADRKTWIRHITEATDAYRIREGKAKKSESNSVVQETTEPVVENEEPNQSVDACENPEGNETGDASDQSENIDVSECGHPEVPIEESEIVTGGAEAMVSATTPEPVTSPNTAPQDTPTASSPLVTKSPIKKFQRVEIFEIIEAPVLIEPSEVVIYDSLVCQTAEPVLTPLEKLRRKETLIEKHLKEKHALVAEILHMPTNEYGIACDSPVDGEKDAKDLIAVAIRQATSLSEMINQNLTVSEEDAVSAGLEGLEGEEGNTNTSKRAQKNATNSLHMIKLSSELNACLTRLLGMITHREEERNLMRKELRSSKEQIYRLHESRQRSPVFPDSRPPSFISGGSADDENDGSTNVINDTQDAEVSVIDKTADALGSEKTDAMQLEPNSSTETNAITASEYESLPPPPTLHLLPSDSVADELDNNGAKTIHLDPEKEIPSTDESNV